MLKLTPLIAALTIAAPAFAGYNGPSETDGYTDVAKVRSVVPQYERVNAPRKECSKETVIESRRTGGERSYGGAVVGAVAGGLLGNQVGGGRGKEAATALGAVVGAMTGDRIDNRDNNGSVEEVPREVQRCRTVDSYQQRITGYLVDYDYKGQHFSTVMSRDPGKTLNVRVSVEPIIN